MVEDTELINDLKNIDANRREVGMVFHQFNLHPAPDRAANCTLAPVSCARSRARSRRGGQGVPWKRVQIPEQAHKYPGQLSGGQQQRVAIARSRCMRPKIRPFDEPTSALDPEMINDVLDVMVDVAGSGMTTLLVTHVIGFAAQIADRTMLVDEGQTVEQNTRTTSSTTRSPTAPSCS